MKEKLNSLKNRIIDNFNKNRIPVIIMLLLWIFVVVFTLSSYSNTLGKISSGNEFFDNVVELADDLLSNLLHLPEEIMVHLMSR